MGNKTKIEWTATVNADGSVTPGASWTPIRAKRNVLNFQTRIGWHCEHVSEGCRNCYAESMNKRFGTGLDFKPGHRADIDIFLDEKMLRAPLGWKRPRKIFVCSMTDIVADFVPDEMIDRMFAVMALCPQHTFQVLTKRAERMRRYFDEVMSDQALGLNRFGIAALATGLHGPEGSIPAWPLPNIWLGTSCEDQNAWDDRLQQLAATPAAIRFVSYEPALGPIEAGNAFDDESDEYRPIDWVISGAESGPRARFSHPKLFRSLRDQCASAGVAYLHKQNGEYILIPADNGDETWPAPWFGKKSPRKGEVAHIERVGKARAGRLLDGVEHNGFPK